MKTQILTLLLFLSFNLFAQSSIENQFEVVLDKWSDEFNNYLINHSDDDLVMIGLHKKYLESSYNKDKELDLIDFNHRFLDVLNFGNLGSKSLMLTESICLSDILKGACDREKIFTKLRQSEPNNLIVYLPALYDANQNNDMKKVKELIKQMSKTTYSFSYFANSQKLDKTIGEYIKLNPFDENINVNALFSINDLKLLSEGMRGKIKENPENVLNVLTKYGYKLVYYIPSYAPITRLCLSEKELSEYCLSISNTLIEHSDTIISILIGYSIKSEAYKLLNKPLLAAAAELEKKKFKSEFTCISKPYNMDSTFDLDIYTLQSKIEREKGEYQALKYVAEINYQKSLERGDEQAIDPNTCYH